MKNLVLLGCMGTGKSTVGRAAARVLGLRFVDMDERIEVRARCRISELFAREGEEGFRRRERALAEELGKQEGLAIATGGGVVLDARNIENLGRRGVLICLRASADRMLERIAGETHRPLLAVENPRQALLSLLAAREPLYAALPHQVDTEDLAPEQAVDAVVRIYREQNRP